MTSFKRINENVHQYQPKFYIRDEYVTWGNDEMTMKTNKVKFLFIKNYIHTHKNHFYILVEYKRSTIKAVYTVSSKS